MSSLTLSKMVGSNEVALLADALAAGHQLGALLLAELDVVEDLVELLLRDLGALLGLGIERVADHAALGLFGQPLDEFVVDLLLDEQPAAGRAALAAVEVDGVERSVDGGIQIGVGEDDVGALAAQLERRALRACRRRPSE